MLKTSLGSELSLAWSHHLSTEEQVRRLQASGRAIVAVERTAESLPYYAVAFPPRWSWTASSHRVARFGGVGVSSVFRRSGPART